MSYDQRLDSALRPNAYRTHVEPARQSANDGSFVTGVKKSTALAELDLARGSAASSPDTGSGATSPGSTEAVAEPSRADATQDRMPAFSFSDLIDVFNPLQHIPIVSNIYRSLTGDEISEPARIAGSALFFGPIGAVASIANIALEDITGKDIGDRVVAMFTDDEADQPDDGNSAGATAAIAASDAPEAASDTPVNAPSMVLADAAGSPAALGTSLSPGQPFSFDPTGTSGGPVASRAIGFAGGAGPVTLDSLPADILAALYSGQPVRQDIPTPGNAGTEPDAGSFQPNSSQSADTAPRWGLWSSPDDTPVVPPSTVARAYGGVIPSTPSQSEGVAVDGGWYGATMSEILARYHDGAVLQRQSHKPFIDVSP